MKPAIVVGLVLLSRMLLAQSATEESAVRKIIQDQVTAWNKGDAEAYSQHFATDGTFTNILGMFYTGHEAFRERHDQIFKGVFRARSRRMLSPSSSGVRMLRSLKPSKR
jgi:SnoaL-like protein